VKIVIFLLIDLIV